jgi:predicted aspartyl protease
MSRQTFKSRIKIISIKGDGYHCIINCRINDKFKTRMLLDTGASRTILDLKFIDELGLTDELKETEEKATGLGTNSMQGHRLILPELKIGKLIMKNIEVGILDLSIVNSSYDMIGLPPIHGAIGGELLKKLKAVISYKDKEIYFEK